MSLEQKVLEKLLKKRVLTVLLLIAAAAVIAAAPVIAAWGAPPAGAGLALPQLGGVAELALPQLGGDAGLTFNDFVGANSFVDENQACYEILGNVREYHPWIFTEWTCGFYSDNNGQTNNSIKSMNPQATFINTWGIFDNYYRTMYEKGIEVTLCLHATADGATWGRPDYQDPDGTKSAVAASYLGHAQSMFQHAARYGGNKNINPNLVRVAVGTAKEIGLGYIRYYENYNEPDLTGFNGSQFAAMLSADYDGHMGTLGPDAGVKAADPDAIVIMGGYSRIMFNTTPHGYYDPRFVDDMLAWFEANRTLAQWQAAHGGSAEGYVKYPFDVISCHGYSASELGYGLSAEESHYYEMLRNYVEKCRQLFPGKEIYFSEFGWDTAAGSPLRATVSSTINTGLTTTEVQGRWLVREYLMAAAAGIDRARQFMIPDASTNPNDPGWFATCGLVHGQQGSANFKPSWYYIGTMKHVLKDAALNSLEILADGGWTASGGGKNGLETNGPWALKFSSTKNNEQIYALWLPTSLGDKGGANVQDYTITVPAGYYFATQVTLQDKVRWGERSDISAKITGGKLTVSIGEKPLFVILGQEEYYNPIQDFIHPRDFTTWTLTPNSGNPSLLFEEQRINLFTNPPPNTQNAWIPGGLHRYAAIDLGAKYDLSSLYVWDGDGALAAGKVLAIYAYTGAGTPVLPPNSMTGAAVQSMLAGNDWQRIAWYDFASWNVWAEASVKAKTRYLVLGFEDGPSTFWNNPWPVDWLPVPEMVIKGALAKTETTTFAGKVLYQTSGKPASIKLCDKAGKPVASAATVDDGAYKLAVPNAPAGTTYTLKIAKPGYLSYTINNFTFTEGEDIEEIDIRQLAGDVNGDGVVNAVDLTCLLSEFNRAPAVFEDADIDGNGIVNAADLTYLLAGFNKRDIEEIRN